MASISDAEGACLPRAFEPDRLMFILSGDFYPETDEWAVLVECLERETLLRLFLDPALSATGGLSRETSVCIRGGVAEPTFSPLPESGDVGSPLAIYLLALACMNEEEFNASVDVVSGVIPEDWLIIQCMVNAVGPSATAGLFFGSVDQEDFAPRERSALEGCLASAEPIFPNPESTEGHRWTA